MSLEIALDGIPPRPVTVTRLPGERALVWIDGRRAPAALRRLGDAWELTLDDRRERVWVASHGDEVWVHAFGRAWRTEVSDPAIRAALAGDAPDVVPAPMPGSVITVAVAPGDAVRRGDVLVVIESMKMQSEIVAWRDGVIERVHVEVGSTFDRGHELVALVSEPAAS